MQLKIVVSFLRIYTKEEEEKGNTESTVDDAFTGQLPSGEIVQRMQLCRFRCEDCYGNERHLEVFCKRRSSH